MTVQPSSLTSELAPQEKQTQRHQSLSSERGNGLPVLFGLDVPTDLPTTILGLQKSSGNQAVAELLHCSEHDTTEANELSGPMSSILKEGLSHLSARLRQAKSWRRKERRLQRQRSRPLRLRLFMQSRKARQPLVRD